ncbi:MAG: lipoyl synthase [Phycisphaerae bacterium]|nr:lipoyl synthase [Phycisphaerae bacterium]
MVRISLSDQILDNAVPASSFVRRGKPRWLRMQLPRGPQYQQLAGLIVDHDLHTVCQEAACPNMGECWSNGVATVMILGDTCTRSCGFCNIKTGRPPKLDTDEPARVAEAVAIMNLRYVVITSVNRDELPDGGAAIWAQTIRRIREASPQTQIEVLIPDFCGDRDALRTVLDARPDVVNHNLETVPRLYRAVRPQARYGQSLELLRRVKEQGFVAKTGIMVGIGERDEEVESLMGDVVEQTRTDRGSCDILTIGQYLQPSPRHLPVHRFVHPDRFEHFKQAGQSLGLLHVESGPMVRSSYHADRQAALVHGSASASS